MIPTRRQLAIALLRNFTHLFTGTRRGGHRVSEWSMHERVAHASAQWDTLGPHLGDVRGLVGMEIGPGDDFGLCRLLIQAGATRMYAVEKYTTPAPPPGVVSLTGEAESMSLPEPVDFAVSNDVLEHVRDVPGTFRSVFTALQPGGVFVSSVDLRGHNCWKSDARPLDFLTCPDWLYRLATCNIETSNRVRFGVLAVAAREVGFKAVHSVALATVDPIYLADVRPHLLPRYQALPDDDLGILQALIVARKSV